MDRDVLKELRQAYLDEWLSREDLMDSFQRGVISYSDFLWIIGSGGLLETLGSIIVEE